MKMMPTILVIKQKKSKKNVGEAVNNVKKSCKSNEMELVKQEGLCIHNL
ncbi:hypothetical protein HMPREF9981_00476 [Staphylococcus epidermidis NIHLM020]|nr:hypothetical protein HMPREF9981_00476 [Staphylococcus epidermidis NIHLM020]